MAGIAESTVSDLANGLQIIAIVTVVASMTTRIRRGCSEGSCSWAT